MSLQQKKIFKFVVLGILGLSLTIYLLSAHEEVLYLYDGVSTYEKDGLQFSNFKITGPSPWKEGDTIIVEFDLKNITGKPIFFGKRGIFVGCLNPNGNKEDFGHQYSKFSLGKGKSVHINAVKKLDKKGKWTFWPSYFLGSTRWTNHRRGYGPYKWRATQIKPSTKPITKFKKTITQVIKPVQVFRDKQIQMEQDGIVRANQDALLIKYETGDRKFIKKKISDYIVYRHMRKIGEAIVEGDAIRYKFDWKTKELLDKKTQWRRDLPGQIPPVIAKSQAEALVEGKVLFSKLYIISPQSMVFRIKPVPRDPCWIVSSNVNGHRVISIINAVTGEFLGYGEPPPAALGYSLVGPDDWSGCYNQFQYWVDLRDNAREWFTRMGYPTAHNRFPNKRDVRSYIYNYETAVFYEVAHSGTDEGEPWNTTFLSGCNPEMVTAMDVRNWITHCPKMPFAFLNSCFSMCDTEVPNTLSYSFRKGSNHDTATVGNCGMSEGRCFSCWLMYLNWQDIFFAYLSRGVSVRKAFDNAMLHFSECDGCIRLAGDETLRLVPKIDRNLGRLIAYWPIREGSGRNVADYTSGHNHGTITAAFWTQGISGPGGILRHWSAALAFDGTDGGIDFVRVDCDAAFNLANFTLEAWVRFINGSQNGGIISRPSDGDPTHGYSFFKMYTSRGRIGGAVQGEGSAQSVNIQSRDKFADGVWHKCTFVRNVNTNAIKIYVDGQLQGTYPNASPGNMNHNRKDLFIGSLDVKHGVVFNGAICNVKIWGKAHTEDEVQKNFMWEADEDGDGIALQVDPAPGAYSNFFKNGSTTGSIIDRGDQVLILIPKSGGVLVKAQRGTDRTTPATVRLDGNNVPYTLNQGEEILLKN